jgi:asparagine synthase (glutamine-hydrolysing)
MCGIAGFFRPAGLTGASAARVASAMADSLTHRGPDDAGTWTDADAGIALGHRRLAVLDLSPAGHQPMASASGRYVLAFNGEIYNHLEIRGELTTPRESTQWRGHSDTETLLAGFDRWGVAATLRRCVGMFAFAAWDREARALILARDRLGEKPLYYGWQGDTLLFGSEIKALRVHPSFSAEIDPTVVSMYLRHGYVPSPRSIYRGIHKLPPGTLLQQSAAGGPTVNSEPRAYWSLSQVVRDGRARPFEGTAEEAVGRLEELLRRAVHGQSVADVPLGAFLSGGIDSTTIVALMQAQSSHPVRTFTIGFREAGYQEAPHAAAVARVLGTVHTQLELTPREAMTVIPQLAGMYDEPFGDSSAVATHLVAHLARQHVTVCLSGDGGDELFAGYTRYQETADAWRLISRVPGPVRRTLAGACRAVARRRPFSAASWRVERMATYLSARTARECYAAKTLQQLATPLVLTRQESASTAADVAAATAVLGIHEQMMYADTVGYLPDDILTKVDRAAMAVSLETRIPLLDHRIVEFAWSLPLDLKVRDRDSKWILKQVLYKYVPAALMQRRKRGFGIPVGEWLRGPLREWAEDLFAESRLRRDGILDAVPVRERWLRHLARLSTEDDFIWQLLMLQAWLAGQRQSPPTMQTRAAV